MWQRTRKEQSEAKRRNDEAAHILLVSYHSTKMPDHFKVLNTDGSEKSLLGGHHSNQTPADILKETKEDGCQVEWKKQNKVLCLAGENKQLKELENAKQNENKGRDKTRAE